MCALVFCLWLVQRTVWLCYERQYSDGHKKLTSLHCCSYRVINTNLIHVKWRAGGFALAPQMNFTFSWPTYQFLSSPVTDTTGATGKQNKTKSFIYNEQNTDDTCAVLTEGLKHKVKSWVVKVVTPGCFSLLSFFFQKVKEWNLISHCDRSSPVTNELSQKEQSMHYKKRAVTKTKAVQDCGRVQDLLVNVSQENKQMALGWWKVRKWQTKSDSRCTAAHNKLCCLPWQREKQKKQNKTQEGRSIA